MINQAWVVLIAGIVALTVVSCASTSMDDEVQAVRVSKTLMREKYGWKKIEVRGADFRDGVWVIFLERKPAMPGGHATIRVDQKDNIIDVNRGR